MPPSKTSSDHIASVFLQTLGAPDTPAMRLAVGAWLKKESGGTIRANNPWNMTLNAAKSTGVRICGSWRSASSGHTFAQFCTVEDGARASAKLLLNAGHDWRNYDGVVTAARAGNPVGFLNALARSAWSEDRYGTKNGGVNSLLGVYKNLGGNVILDTYSEAAIGSGGGTGAATAAGGTIIADAIKNNNLADAKFINIPEGKIITAADVDYIMTRFATAGFWKNDTTGAAQSVTRSILNGAIGKPWNKATRDDLQSQLLKAAGNAIPAPLAGISSIGSILIQIAGALFDPRKWAYILALIAGAFLTWYGGANVLAAAR